ncbi:hypothetical protein BD779DRAFT_1572787 [Infundibulicybe gibba]|nr:hypothetical protein BD779DRAFT_1572787 [Infundibulicybe gibba]
MEVKIIRLLCSMGKNWATTSTPMMNLNSITDEPCERVECQYVHNSRNKLVPPIYFVITMSQPPVDVPTVPTWIDGRLQNIVNAVPAIHYEHSLYGPLNAYFHTFFPPTQSFMIKPQGMLRPDHYPFDSDIFGGIGAQKSAPRLTRDETLGWVRRLMEGDEVAGARVGTAAPVPPAGRDEPKELDIFQGMDDESTDSDENDIDGDAENDNGMDLDPEASHVSKDSYGVKVERTNKGIRYPDFIIVKATEGLNKDKILLIVEVKRDGDSRTAARLQIATHLKMAENKHRVRFLQGLLILGGATESYFLDSSETAGIISKAVHLSTTGPRLKARINAIAVANW